MRTRGARMWSPFFHTATALIDRIVDFDIEVTRRYLEAAQGRLNIRAVIPQLIECGVDILDLIQVAAEGMDFRGLVECFGERLAFNTNSLVFSATWCWYLRLST